MEKSTAVNFKERWTVQILQNSKKNKMTWKTDKTSAVFQGNLNNHHHHFQQIAKLYVVKEGSFPIPLKYVDVVSRTNCHIGCFARQANQ